MSAIISITKGIVSIIFRRFIMVDGLPGGFSLTPQSHISTFAQEAAEIDQIGDEVGSFGIEDDDEEISDPKAGSILNIKETRENGKIIQIEIRFKSGKETFSFKIGSKEQFDKLTKEEDKQAYLSKMGWYSENETAVLVSDYISEMQRSMPKETFDLAFLGIQNGKKIASPPLAFFVGQGGSIHFYRAINQKDTAYMQALTHAGLNTVTDEKGWIRVAGFNPYKKLGHYFRDRKLDEQYQKIIDRKRAKLQKATTNEEREAIQDTIDKLKEKLEKSQRIYSQNQAAATGKSHDQTSIFASKRHRLTRHEAAVVKAQYVKRVVQHAENGATFKKTRARTLPDTPMTIVHKPSETTV